MITGIQKEKQSSIYNQRIYIAVPKRLYTHPILSRARKYLGELNALSVDDPRGMFSSNAEWEAYFPGYLQEYDAIVVVTNNGLIGRGVFLEVRDFKSRNKPRFAYIENDGVPSLRQIVNTPIINPNNWTDYARVNYKEGMYE